MTDEQVKIIEDWKSVLIRDDTPELRKLANALEALLAEWREMKAAIDTAYDLANNGSEGSLSVFRYLDELKRGNA